MAEKGKEVANYGNWVSSRIILAPAVFGLIFAAISFLSLYLLIPAGAFLLVAGYFAYTRRLFSPKGRNLQEKIRSLVLNHIEWTKSGTALDIGCGSGALTIGLAKKFSQLKVVGTDYWGGSWQYSQSLCLSNAQIENVEHRVSFQKASASALPFANQEFDIVVSNLVFHEVRDSSNKIDLIKEALRVLKKGGKFVFQDLFFIRHYYGKPEDLVQTIKDWGVGKAELIPTKDSTFIPLALKLPFMVGTLGLITGEK